MQNSFDLLRKTRNNYFRIVQNLSLEQLNQIPEGFSNNIAWNLGHIIVTQQLLVYRLSGLDAYVDDETINAYRKGSKPGPAVDQATIDQFCKQLYSLLDQMIKDYEEGIFKNYKTYTTSYGVELKSVEEAIEFNNLHEAMHLGSIIALKKFV